MSIITQTIALVITLYVFIIWQIHHKLDSSADSIFTFAIINVMISIVSDSASQFIISGTVEAPPMIKEVFMDCFLIGIPTYVIVMGLYVTSYTLKQELYEKVRTWLLMLAVLNAVIIVVLPFECVHYPLCSLAEGPAVQYCYIVSLVFGILVLSMFIYFRKKIELLKYIVGLFWVIIFILGGIVQYFTIYTYFIPIMSITMSAGILTLYLVFENPGNKYDYDKNCFYYDIFIEYINEIIRNKEVMSCLYLNIDFKGNDSFSNTNEFFTRLLNINEKNSNIRIFGGHHNELIVLSREMAELQDFANSILSCLNSLNKEVDMSQAYRASIVFIPSLDRTSNFDSLRTIFNNYQVKNSNSTDTIEVHSVDDSVIGSYNTELEIATAIDKVIKNDTLESSYRTIESFEGKDKIDVEARISLKVDEGIILEPIDFIDVATKYNKLVQIDELTIKKVCSDIGKIAKHSNKLGKVFIRVSVQIIEQEGFANNFVEGLSSHSIPLSNICLEFTNAKAISNKEIFVANLRLLKNNGVSIAIGGFGLGESNINYLIDLPVDYVKYDPTLLNNALADDKGMYIMKEITDLTKRLGYSIICVGIDDENGVKATKDCGIDLSMGRLVSKNYSENEFISLATSGGAQ